MNNIKQFKEKYLQKLNNYLYNLQKKFPLLKRINIEITRQCNLKCLHCYMDSTPQKDKNEITTQDIYNLADELSKNGYNNIEIVFTGGEPLIKNDFANILKYYKKLGFKCFLVTNGTLLTKEKFDEIKLYISGLSISLDGFEKYHNYFRGANSFNIIVENIKYIIKTSNKDFFIKTVLSKENILDLEQFYNFLLSLGVKKWHIIALSNKGRGKGLDFFLDLKDFIYINNFLENKKEIQIIYDNPLKKDSKRCICGIDEFSILYNGDILGCLNADRINTEKYGNIKNDDIIEVRNDTFKKYRTPTFYNCNN